MHFSKTLATAATFAMTAYASFPVASVSFLSWEKCDVGHPALGEPKFSAEVSATPVTCDKTTVNRDWSIDNYSFRAHMDTKDTFACHGVTIWNNDGCAGEPVHFLPFHHGPFTEGQCLPDILGPGYVSFKLACHGFH
ncbi:hypothetical protein E8E15_002653 [Penicillium rubens]|uniref:uncharacterized protein n=1 Tax=Penicillium rubens TaxID=1108849 RepID=UPI001D9846C5|nr:uncharacterized protein N7525_001117 [Penicillium rubens]KAF3012521.1 hypothetical protein E8E15_002653 [Penicillium rubens]KAJ5039194.1 hypothetical protein NUH16_008975 [Penicillium rubens]KAJ5843376.1 hypothetical protein N7525_001117 [Penicillium rubens]